MSVCKDCIAQGITTTRKVHIMRNGNPAPGKRCKEHYYAQKRAASQRAHGRRVENVYGITDVEYWALYEAQGGRCYICQRATGARRRLAVDHDHTCTAGHDPEVGCRSCIRCLACKTCNSVVLGRYSEDALRRAIDVLRNHPAQTVLLGMDE